MTGFFGTRLLSVAMQRDIFTHLYHSPQTFEQTRDYLKFPDRPCRIFLDGLVVLGLLAKEGDRYRNSAVAETYLVKGRSEFQGANVKLFGNLYDACRELEAALVSDSPTTTSFAYFFGDDDASSANYAEIMHESGVVPSLLLMEHWDFGESEWLLDVGGGSGRLAATLASQYASLNVILFDPPPICDQAQDYLTPFPALSNRVEIYPGDFFRDDLPDGADTIVMMRVLHDWPDDTVRMLLRKAYKALRPGGRLLVYETMRRSDDKPDETFAISMLMLLISPAGKIRSFREISDLVREARFTNVEVIPTAYLYSLIVGEKPNVGDR